jgi:hypothetical protein
MATLTTRRGRPPKPPGEKKSERAAFRVSESLYQRLADVASANNRPLSAEIEYRLRLSLDADPEVESFGGSVNYWILRLAGGQFAEIERIAAADRQHPQPWWQSPYAHAQVKILIAAFLDFLRPPGRAVVPRHLRGKAAVGRQLAEREIASVEAVAISAAGLDGYLPHQREGLSAGTVTSPWPRGGAWAAAAQALADKLTSSPLKKLYDTERTKK